MNNCGLKCFHILVMMLILSGCSMFRKVFKSNEYIKQEFSSVEKRKKEGWNTDGSILTIREQLDTIVIIPEKIIKQNTYFCADSLVNGLTVIQNDLLDVSLIFQPKTGMLSALAVLKPKHIPIKFNKETILQNDVRRHATESSYVKKNSKLEQSHSSIEKNSINNWYYMFGPVIFALVSFSLFYWLKKRYL